MNTAAHAVQVLPQSIDYIRVLPEIVLSLFGILVMLADLFWTSPAARKGIGTIALAGSFVFEDRARRVRQAWARMRGIAGPN